MFVNIIATVAIRDWSESTLKSLCCLLSIFKDIFSCSVLLFDSRVVPVRLSVLPKSWMKNNDMILKTTAFLYIPNYQITKTSTCTWNTWNYNIDSQFRNYNEGLARPYLCTAYPSRSPGFTPGFCWRSV